MRKEYFFLCIVGIIGMVTSLIGILISAKNDTLLLSMWSFIAFSIIACSVLLVDKKL